MQTQLINFTIPKLLLKDVDFLAKKKRSSRSELLREAVRVYLEREETRSFSFELIKKAADRTCLSEERAMELAEEAKAWARREK